jgi:hypothetical protein
MLDLIVIIILNKEMLHAWEEMRNAHRILAEKPEE